MLVQRPVRLFARLTSRGVPVRSLLFLYKDLDDANKEAKGLITSLYVSPSLAQFAAAVCPMLRPFARRCCRRCSAPIIMSPAIRF